MRLSGFPSFVRSTNSEDIMFHFMNLECWDCLKSDALLLNTFDEFEQEAIEAIKTKYKYSNVLPVGPLSLMEEKHIPKNISNQFISSLWKQDSKVFEWLDSRAPESVLFVNYGCVAVLSENQFQELAWGIANSKQQSMWIVRPDVVKDGSATLSEEFLEETKERGFITTCNWWRASDLFPVVRKSDDELLLFLQLVGDWDHVNPELVLRLDVVKDGSATLSAEFLEEIKERGFITTWRAQEKFSAIPRLGRV
ncbi:hypothetical protein Leryth_013632 [Lithospermum erythrorhizon]|nr:hypothetical protein Leryth_013632 [Lithospermum erythrorhizon]